jgi:NarL family two-component system sensor histidine kinase LiaS
MRWLRRITAVFTTLRGKLTLTYTLVTVAALLALEVLALLALVAATALLGSSERGYVSDVILTLYPQAAAYWEGGDLDRAGLQAWAEEVYASGRASAEPMHLFDSPLAPIVEPQPLYVLSPDGEILAQAPPGENPLIGRQYQPPAFPGAAEAAAAALANELEPLQLSAETPRGDLFLAFPIRDPEQETLLGAIVLTIADPPSFLVANWRALLGIVLGTGLVLLLGVAPFGALFGFIMARGLTRRLADLTAAADAWSRGDFAVTPQDRSRDEIGVLGERLRYMAEQVQHLLETRQELSAMEERNRLARDLHDTVKQQTFATLMQVRAAKNLAGRDPETAVSHLAEAETLLKQAQGDLHSLIAELRPAALADEGLVAALRHYAAAWGEREAIPATVRANGERPLPLAVEQALYRVAQEALANAARHSEATAVTLHLDYTNEAVILTVADNGTGFEGDAPPQRGFGLTSMAQRVEAHGGALDVTAAPGQGTTITAAIPTQSPGHPVT